MRGTGVEPTGEAHADQEHHRAPVSGETSHRGKMCVRSEMVATEIVNTAAIRMA